MLFQAEYIAEWNTNCGREKKKRQINRQKNTGNVYALFLNFLFSARSGELWARLFKERGKRVLHAVSGTLSVFLYQEMFMRVRVALILSQSVLLVATVACFAQQQKPPAGQPKEGVLTADVVSAKLMPEKVFFHGQLTKVQSSNSGVVRYLDDSLVVAGLVDNPGWALGLSDKYQGYLITEVSMVLGGQTLMPGAYGFGFLDGGKFVVMDLSSWDLFTISSTSDAELKSSMPLQFVAGPDAGKYRLYKGREFVEFKRVKLLRIV